MRSIVINAEDRTVSETDIDASLHSLQEIVGGLIDPVYPGLEGTGHHCYVNDEGLLNDPQHFFMLKDGHQPLAGNGVILSTTGDGDEAPCALPLHWVKEQVTFMDVQAVRAWVAREPSQEAFGSFIGEAADKENYLTPGNGQQATETVMELPPDPEDMNNDRAEWAASALRQFQCVTGTDYDDAVPDLLCDLMHWCDRNEFDFDRMLERARYHYVDETMADAREENVPAGECVEITDSKAAKKEALAEARAEVEQSVGQEHGNGNSR